MIVNEQALLRAIKEAHKVGNLHVAVFNGGGAEQVLIHSLSWLVIMERKNVPGKVRGYVAEKVGEWPKAGEAYIVKTKEVQTEQLEVVLDRLNAIRDKFLGAAGKKIMPTQLLMGPAELWQCCKSMEMVLMDPALTDIIGDSRVSVFRSDNILAAVGEISTIYLYTVRENETTKPILGHLQKMRWVPEQ